MMNQQRLPVRNCDGVIEVSLQESTLRFERALPGTDPRYHFAINIPRGSIEQAATWMEERRELLAFHRDADEEEGATVARTDSGASAIYFLDGAGNVAELIANDHLDNDSDAPFGRDSFLEIAEIGRWRPRTPPQRERRSKRRYPPKYTGAAAKGGC